MKFCLADGFVEKDFVEFRFSPDGKYLVGAGIRDRTEGTLIVWNVENGRMIAHDKCRVERIIFDPGHPRIRVWKQPVQDHVIQKDDYTLDLLTGEISDEGKIPFIGFAENGEIYSLLRYYGNKHSVARAPLYDSSGKMNGYLIKDFKIGEPRHGMFVAKLKGKPSWEMKVPGHLWDMQNPSDYSIWLLTDRRLYKITPQMQEPKLVAKKVGYGAIMGADGRLLLTDEKLIVDMTNGKKRKISKKIIKINRHNIIIPGSKSIMVIPEEGTPLKIYNAANMKLEREVDLEDPIFSNVLLPGTFYQGESFAHPCAWHEPTQQFAYARNDIRIIDTQTGKTIRILKSNQNVRKIRAVIKEEKEEKIRRDEAYRAKVREQREKELAEAMKSRLDQEDVVSGGFYECRLLVSRPKPYDPMEMVVDMWATVHENGTVEFYNFNIQMSPETECGLASITIKNGSGTWKDNCYEGPVSLLKRKLKYKD